MEYAVQMGSAAVEGLLDASVLMRIKGKQAIVLFKISCYPTFLILKKIKVGLCDYHSVCMSGSLCILPIKF
jgi:hypothetical protein